MKGVKLIIIYGFLIFLGIFLVKLANVELIIVAVVVEIVVIVVVVTVVVMIIACLQPYIL